MTTGSRTEGIKGIGAEGFIRTVKSLTVTGDLVVHGETRSTAGTGIDVAAFWETADANANYWAYELPSGGGVAVPVMGVGIGLKDVDLGLFDGLTQPTLAVLDADRDSYLILDFSADDSPRIRSNQDITVSGNAIFSDNITLAGRLIVDGDRSLTPGDGGAVHLDTHTVTDSNTSESGTAALYTHVRLEAPTLAATNASVTTTDAATLYISAAATAGTNQTITNNYALLVDAGASRFDGAISMTGDLTIDGDLNFTGPQTIETSAGALGITSAGAINFTTSSNAAASFKIYNGTTYILYPDWRTTVGTVGWMTWNKGATGFASHADLTPWFFRLIAGTITLTGTTTVTAMNGTMLELGAQTITDTSSVTVTKASALYIKNVVAAGSVTITNNYAIDTEAGAFLTAAGVWTDNPSTLTKKNDVLDISPANLRGAIRAIHPRQWIYKDEWNDAGQQRYGIVAEELPGFLKPLGTTQNDVVQPSIMAGFALAGVHHLEDRITQLEAQVAALS